jgi:hypothetical protein
MSDAGSPEPPAKGKGKNKRLAIILAIGANTSKAPRSNLRSKDIVYRDPATETDEHRRLVRKVVGLYPAYELSVFNGRPY